MKLKKYKVIGNPNGYTFHNGDALGVIAYGFKSYSAIYLLDKDPNTIDDYCYYYFNSNDCIEVPEQEEVHEKSTAKATTTSLLTAIGDKPSKITIEF